MYKLTQWKLSYVRRALEDDDETSLDPSLELYGEQQNFSLPFFWGSQADTGARLQPLPSQLSFIWEIFVDRVDPFIKVLHVPTTYEIIKTAKCKPFVTHRQCFPRALTSLLTLLKQVKLMPYPLDYGRSCWPYPLQR